AASRIASPRSRTPTSRSSKTSENPQAPRNRLALPLQDAHALGLRRVWAGHLSALLRNGRLLRLPGRRQPANPALRIARRGRDGHVVGDEHDRGLGDAARALAGHARGARRHARELRADPAPGDDRDGDDRDLQPRRDPALGTAPLRHRPDRRPPAAVRAFDPGDRPHLRRARLPVRRLLRPLPRSLGAREHVRVPGLADLRVPRAAALLPLLGAADLLGPRADLGHERDQGVVPRRLAAPGSPHVLSARLGLHRARLPRHGAAAPSRPRTCRALADLTSVRLFFVGGLTSYRALFYWLSPTIYIPSLIVAPIFQILLFAYIGRSAGLESDVFYVTGNAIQYAAIPCLFAMSQTVSGERFQNTLSAILVSPAKRFPLFVGRALPVMGNAAFVSAFSFP